MTVTDLSGKGCVGALIDELTCPYCGDALVPEGRIETDSEPLEYGVLTCGCGHAPVVGGIVWLSRRHGSLAPQDDPVIRRVLNRLRAGDHRGALCEALLGSFRDRYRRVGTALERIGARPPEWLLNQARQRLIREVLEDGDLTFAGAAALLRNGPYARYLHHRFANPSMMAAIPAMLLLKELAKNPELPPRVLEVGGGCGHATFLMQRYFPELQIILTDGDFVNLYLARRFIAPRAMCLCLDAEARLPFAEGGLGAVFCMDAFHYVREKVGLVEELRRIVHPNGLWLFPHLHNARAQNPTPGYPLSPRGYARAFAGVDTRILSEADVLRTFHDRVKIDLSGPRDEGLSSDAAALTLIGGPETLWQSHDLSELYQRTLPDLDLNTVYSVGTGGGVEMRWPSIELERECEAAREYLDPEPVIDAGLLKRMRAGSLLDSDQEAVHTLLRNFVLVPLPADYR